MCYVVTSLYEKLRDKFEKLRAAEVNFFCTLVQDPAKKLEAKAVTGFPYHQTFDP